LRLGKPIFGDDQQRFRDLRRRCAGGDAPRQQGPPGDGRPEQLRRGMMAGEHYRASHLMGSCVCLHDQAQAVPVRRTGAILLADCFGCAKIIRPATVCSTRVTVTSMVLPMNDLPPSTTIIVPSSR
jgi:hypothetical protein